MYGKQLYASRIPVLAVLLLMWAQKESEYLTLSSSLFYIVGEPQFEGILGSYIQPVAFGRQSQLSNYVLMIGINDSVEYSKSVKLS